MLKKLLSFVSDFAHRYGMIVAVIGVCMAGYAVVLVCHVIHPGSGPSLRILTRECSCGHMQTVEPDAMWWTCKKCGNTAATGKQPLDSAAEDE